MKKLFLTLACVTALAAQTNEKTYTGVITDTMCGSDHAHMGVSPDTKCVRDCVKSNPTKWKYALLTDDKKVLVLSDQATPEKFAAQKVKVKGVLYEKTGILKVNAIQAQ